MILLVFSIAVSNEAASHDVWWVHEYPIHNISCYCFSHCYRKSCEIKKIGEVSLYGKSDGTTMDRR